MLSVDVRCRIDPKTKEDAAEVIESMGLTVSDAIRLFLTRVASEGAIPFELRVPNAKTVAAIAELESSKGRSKLKRHKNLDAMHDAIRRK
jgi:DNA-damage-inducible protein J